MCGSALPFDCFAYLLDDQLFYPLTSLYISVLPYSTNPIAPINKRSCSPPDVFLSKTTTPMKQHGMSPLLKTVPQPSGIISKTEISPPRSASRFVSLLQFLFLRLTRKQATESRKGYQFQTLYSLRWLIIFRCINYRKQKRTLSNIRFLSARKVSRACVEIFLIINEQLSFFKYWNSPNWDFNLILTNQISQNFPRIDNSSQEKLDSSRYF